MNIKQGKVLTDQNLTIENKKFLRLNRSNFIFIEKSLNFLGKQPNTYQK